MAMTPIGELRLAIPMGVLVYQLDPVLVFFVSVVGNLIPALVILFFLKKVSVYLSAKSNFFQKLFNWWANNTKGKHSDKIEKYGAVGLALFIAVPLPLTGAWTGALLSTLMNLPLKKSAPAVFAGVIGAGIIVSALVFLGINIEKYLGWQVLALLLLAIVFCWITFKIIKNGK